MKGFYGALLTAMLLTPAGVALADQSSEMNQAEIGSANTKEGSTKPEGGTAAGRSTGGTTSSSSNAPRAGNELPSGPDEDMSTQTGSANTKPGDTAVQGGTASGNGGSSGAQGSNVPRADGEIPSGPDKDMSTQTGSANTQPGDTEVKGGSAAQ